MFSSPLQVSHSSLKLTRVYWSIYLQIRFTFIFVPCRIILSSKSTAFRSGQVRPFQTRSVRSRSSISVPMARLFFSTTTRIFPIPRPRDCGSKDPHRLQELSVWPLRAANKTMKFSWRSNINRMCRHKSGGRKSQSRHASMTRCLFQWSHADYLLLAVSFATNHRWRIRTQWHWIYNKPRSYQLRIHCSTIFQPLDPWRHPIFHPLLLLHNNNIYCRLVHFATANLVWLAPPNAKNVNSASAHCVPRRIIRRPWSEAIVWTAPIPLPTAAETRWQ